MATISNLFTIDRVDDNKVFSYKELGVTEKIRRFFMAFSLTIISLGFALISSKVRGLWKKKKVIWKPFDKMSREDAILCERFATVNQKPDILYQLSLYYKQKENLNEEMRLLEFAAHQGCLSAQWDLAEINYKKEMKNVLEAIRWYSKAADQGHKDAQYRYGEMCLKGEGVIQDYKQAAYYFCKAANQGHTLAKRKLAILYLEKKVEIQNNNGIIVRLFQRAADQGDAEALYYLGRMHQMGLEVHVDESKAFHWYALAANKGHPIAQYKLACKHREREEVLEAVHWYNVAAGQGYVPALLDLGDMYREGKEIAKDKDQAIKKYSQAVEQEDPNALYKLGRMYLEEGKEEEAIDLLKFAAEKRHSESQFVLGKFYEEREEYSQAAYWYDIAAHEGVVDAQLNLALMHLEDRIENRDNEKAAELLEFAASKNVAKAQCCLGEMHLLVNKDEEKAIFWFKKAAEQQYPGGYFNLGWMDIEKDLKNITEQAVQLLSFAAEKGHPLSQLILEMLNKKWVSVVPNEKEAVCCYRSAANLGCNYGRWALGKIIKEGAHDDQEAFRLFELAAKEDFVPAQFELAEMYREGRGVKKDERQASDWLMKAVRKRYAPAQVSRGSIHEKQGEYQQAIQLYELAVEQKYPVAEDLLGVMYAAGKVEGKDENDALPMFLSAAEKNYAPAQYHLGEIYEKREKVFKAFDLFKLAADQGYTPAMISLGKMYKNGIGVYEKNLQRARYYYQLAKERGDKTAQYHLSQLQKNGLFSYFYSSS